MSVKLLQKSQIADLKSKAQQREINEGVKIATRIDGLRKLWSQTEQDFESYKVSILERINEEISSLEEKKEKLIQETRQEKIKRDSIMPEVIAKQKELSAFEKSLNLWDKKLEKRESHIESLEANLAENIEFSETSRIMHEDNERISANLLRESNEKKIEAQRSVSEAHQLQEKTAQWKNGIEKELNEREVSIQAKEKELSRKESELMNKEKQLDSETIKVNDTRATLERSIARIKSGKLP